MKQIKLRCIVCDEIPDEGIHVSGVKFIKGEKEPYNICKACCLGRGQISFNDQLEYRKYLWEQVENKIRARHKKVKNKKN